MPEYGGLELCYGIGEQSLFAGVAERREEIPRPFARITGERFPACLQDEPVSALPAPSRCPVDVLQQFIWNMERRGWHE
jgi:hypothetical protein